MHLIYRNNLCSWFICRFLPNNYLSFRINYFVFKILLLVSGYSLTCYSQKSGSTLVPLALQSVQYLLSLKAFDVPPL